MRVQIPIPIESYITDVPEDDYPEFITKETGYALEDRVVVLIEHNIYESLKNSNTAAPSGKTDENWALVGKTNAHKAIDDKVSTQTEFTGTKTFGFPTLKSTSLAFVNTQCSSIKVEILEAEEIIYSKEIAGFTRNTTGWFSYFFGEFKFKKFFLFEHFYNPYATYRITISGTSCKVGVISRGMIVNLGNTRWNPSVKPTDYSKYETDKWGETYLREGKFSLTARGIVGIETSKLASILDIFIARRGKLSLYIPTDVLSFPPILGYVKSPELLWENPVRSFYTLDIEGVS